MTEPAPSQINVLLVEDSPNDAELIGEALRRAGLNPTLKHVETEEAFLAALSVDLDVILADFDVPNFGAVRALDLLKAANVDVPLIVVSGSIGEETAVRILQRGAADYLLKDRLTRLGQAIKRAMDERASRRQQRLIEEALDAAEARMRFALEAARVGVWDADVQSGRQVWSETLEALHGIAPGAFEGTREAFQKCVHAADWPQVEQAIAATERRGEDANLLYRTVWPDGSVHWIAGRGRTFYDESGRAIRAAGIGWDVTERHALEEQYRQSQKMEAVGLLAGGVAHDFNNLLTVIQGFCSLVIDATDPDSPNRADLLEIQGAADRAAALTRQLLAFSRRQKMEPQVLDLEIVLNSLEPMLKRLIREDISVETKSTAEGRIRADPGQIEQVLVNLAVNARDAMPHGGRLTITVTDSDSSELNVPGQSDIVPGRYVKLAVSDTGTGMDEATKARIFEPFFTTKPTGQGTGLGLSTVYGIVKQSGGHVSVQSAPGKGSTFTIFMPRVDEPVETRDKTQAPDVAGGAESILVAEDEENVRRLIRRVIEHSGYHVLMASTPHEAIDIAKHHPGPIDLLLTDVIMPEMTGPALAAQIVAIRPGVKVIYMSGYTDKAIMEGTGLDRTIPFIQKPFATDVLVRKVREALDARDHPKAI
jgi:PAS domain S-box-containing protein